MRTNKQVFIIGIVVYIVAAVASYGFFSQTGSVKKVGYETPVSTADNSTDEFAGQPLTEECPINGKLYPKSQKEKWEARRPLGIMIQNNKEARMQSGLSGADVLYEVVAEGGITRFLGIFYCENPKIVGSVRSARVYYLDLLQEYGTYPLYAHVGGANTPGPADALGMIEDLGWANYNDLNQFSVPFPNFWRDYDRLPGRATEHTVYTDTNKLWKYAAEKRELSNVDEDGNEWNEDFVSWEFKDDAKDADRGNVNAISFGFWDQFGADYGVVWKYDKANNVYLRENGGEKHIDLNTEKQLAGKNIIIVFADEDVADDGYEHGEHLLYDLTGTGDTLIFQDGKATEGSWEKEDEESRMTFSNEDGDEIAMVRGKIWIEVLPTGNDVNYGASITPVKQSGTGSGSGSSGNAE